MSTVSIEYKVNGEVAWPSRRAAEHLGLSPGRMSQIVREGSLEPCASINGPGGRMWLFWPDDVERFRAQKESGCEPEDMGKKRLPSEMLHEIHGAFHKYVALVRTSRLSPQSQTTYIRHAGSFVRWLHGDFEPGGGRR